LKVIHSIPLAFKLVFIEPILLLAPGTAVEHHFAFVAREERRLLVEELEEFRVSAVFLQLAIFILTIH